MNVNLTVVRSTGGSVINADLGNINETWDGDVCLCLIGLQTAGCIYPDSGASARHGRRLLDNDLRSFVSYHCHDERLWCHHWHGKKSTHYTFHCQNSLRTICCYLEGSAAPSAQYLLIYCTLCSHSWPKLKDAKLCQYGRCIPFQMAFRLIPYFSSVLNSSK